MLQKSSLKEILYSPKRSKHKSKSLKKFENKDTQGTLIFSFSIIVDNSEMILSVPRRLGDTIT